MIDHISLFIDSQISSSKFWDLRNFEISGILWDRDWYPFGLRPIFYNSENGSIIDFKNFGFFSVSDDFQKIFGIWILEITWMFFETGMHLFKPLRH